MREDDRGWGPLTNNLTYSTLHLFCGSGGAALQGFPLTVDGEPLELSGRSQARWRERIGNAVPVQAAAAIGDVILGALLRASEGWWLCDQGMNAEVWVERKSKGAAK